MSQVFVTEEEGGPFRIMTEGEKHLIPFILRDPKMFPKFAVLVCEFFMFDLVIARSDLHMCSPYQKPDQYNYLWENIQ